MRYFKDDIALKMFIRRRVFNNKKSTEHSFFRDKFEDEIYVRNSSKKYNSIDKIIDELKENGLLYVIQHIHGPYPQESESMGYVLFYTQMLRYMNSNDEYLNNDSNKFKLLTINQVCDFLNISRPSVYKLLKDNTIPYLEILGHKRIQLNELLKYIQRNQSQ